MGEESVKGANMGVILIIFAAILALGLIIFMLARGMANEGLTNVTEKLEAASQSEFTDFDQSVVVGQRVLSAMSSFKGKKVAILVATQALTDKVSQAYTSKSAVTATSTTSKASAVLKSTANVTGHDDIFFAVGAVYSDTPSERYMLPAIPSGKTLTNGSVQLTFVQYNAILEATGVDGVPVTSATATERNSVIMWNEDHYTFSGSYRQSDGKTVFDSIYANTTKSGYTEMIPSSARYNANLLKDENGVILGVVFQQVGA